MLAAPMTDDPKVATCETTEHLARHVELHAALDELLTCFLLAHKHKVPSRTTVLELMTWSHEATREPLACGTVATGRPLSAAREQMALERKCYVCGSELRF